MPPASTVAVLTSELWAHGLTQITPRLRGFAINLVGVRRDQIDSVRVLSSDWPESLSPSDLPLEKRTRNCLERAGLMHSPNILANVTFGQLFSISGMGAVSVLDFASTAESAIERFDNLGPVATAFVDAAATDRVLDLIDEPWVTEISGQDPRFADLLPIGSATLYERIDALTEKPLEGEHALLELSEAVPALRRRIQEIEALPLDIALKEFLHSLTGISDRRFDALLARFGWGGNESVTLEAAGAIAGVTRERIRQLQQRVLRRLPDHAVFMPALDRGLEALQQRVPLDRTQAALLLQKQGISSKAFEPISLLEAAVMLKRTPKLRHETYRGHSRIVTTTVPASADSLISIAQRQAGASGASNVQEVVGEATARGIQTSESEVLSLLREFSDLEFLETEWFWHPNGPVERNRLRNATRKMLAVASPLGIATAREGLRREYRFRSYGRVNNSQLVVPPKSVLRGLYRAHGDFRIDEQDNLRPAAPLDYREELGETERILVDVLRSFPTCVLDRASYLTACAERGMNENTFSIYLTYSSIIAHLGTDIWSLRGIQIDPAAVEAVRQLNAASSRTRRVLDHGWTEDGCLWVAVRLPPQGGANFVFGIPAAVKQYLAAREFEATSFEGAPCGKIKVRDDGVSWGYSSFLKRSGADEGDILIVTFRLAKDRAILRLVDDEVLDEISPEA